jgi:hypothetical protein
LLDKALYSIRHNLRGNRIKQKWGTGKDHLHQGVQSAEAFCSLAEFSDNPSKPGIGPGVDDSLDIRGSGGFRCQTQHPPWADESISKPVSDSFINVFFVLYVQVLGEP